MVWIIAVRWTDRGGGEESDLFGRAWTDRGGESSKGPNPRTEFMNGPLTTNMYTCTFCTYAVSPELEE